MWNSSSFREGVNLVFENTVDGGRMPREVIIRNAGGHDKASFDRVNKAPYCSDMSSFKFNTIPRSSSRLDKLEQKNTKVTFYLK
ncbi:hypothetical protein TrVGV298_002332 [Trichoderma virens]|nr:hypothetical protein TrVGV298_002332 [Trichoderma virens]